jgi:hypothetical protein
MLRQLEARRLFKLLLSLVTKVFLVWLVQDRRPVDVCGKSEETVSPATYTLPWVSRAREFILSLLDPPRKVEARRVDRSSLNLVMNPSPSLLRLS